LSGSRDRFSLPAAGGQEDAESRAGAGSGLDFDASAERLDRAG